MIPWFVARIFVFQNGEYSLYSVHAGQDNVKSSNKHWFKRLALIRKLNFEGFMNFEAFINFWFNYEAIWCSCTSMLTQRHCFQRSVGTDFALRPLLSPDPLLLLLTGETMAWETKGSGIIEFFNWLFTIKNSWREVKNATTLSHILLKHLSLHTWRLESRI